MTGGPEFGERPIGALGLLDPCQVLSCHELWSLRKCDGNCANHEIGLTLYLKCPILGSSNSASNNDMMAKIWTSGDTITYLRRKFCG